ncbi:transposase [Bacillus alkalisoli]|uniref:transposase n=1 Tax=Bacillus alkalisoli TaxID=2011008 RepID=UPI000C230CA2|nr:transposase [Bacillus alkalisoli]
MPRAMRRKSSTGVYHVIMRGINRQTIFEDANDKKVFIGKLRKLKELCNYQLYAYCLMDNHVHLLIKESKEVPISEVIKRISASYVLWYNSKYERSGHLFQGRYRSEPVETTDYFLTVLRYIHQNQLKAGLVKTVFESSWTSLNEYLTYPTLVNTEFVLNLFSKKTTEATALFKKHMSKQNDDVCLEMEVKPSDFEVVSYLNKIGIPHKSVLQQLEKSKRNAILAEMKKLKGVSIVQLSRITGISRSVIQRAK